VVGAVQKAFLIGDDDPLPIDPPAPTVKQVPDQKDQNRGTSKGAPIHITTFSTMPSRTKSMKR